MINLPIYRAKRINSDEYVFGVPRQDSKGMFEMIINVVEDGIPGVIQRYIEVDTISIHFPDMLDSLGNKIFASLQEDGKGGDLIDNFSFIEKYRIQIAIYKDNCFYLVDVYSDRHNLKEFIDKGGIRVMGIQQ